MKKNDNLSNKEKGKRAKSTQRNNYIKTQNNNQQYLNNISDNFDFSDISDISLNDTPSLSSLISSFDKKSINSYQTQSKFLQKNNDFGGYNLTPFFKEEKTIKQNSEKLVKGLISYYIFVSDLNDDIKQSKSLNINRTSEYYLINENWINKYKRAYLYDELIKEIRQMKSCKEAQIIYNQLSSDYFRKIKINGNITNFDLLTNEEIIYDDNIKYPSKFKIIDKYLFSIITNNINKNANLTKINYLINEGKLFIKYNSYDINEIIIANYDYSSDVYNTELIYCYYNKQDMDNHYYILSNNLYSKEELCKFMNGKNVLINNSRE